NLGSYRPSFNADKTIRVVAGGTSDDVKLGYGWEGRVQKLTGHPKDPATWIEFHFDAWQGMTFGDVSLIRGYNGPALLVSHDRSLKRGFSQNLYPNAPQRYKVRDSNRTPVLAATEPYTGGKHEELVSYYRRKLKRHDAYVVNTDVAADQGTKSKHLIIEFF
ncbi:unnamed protein product, partial [Adineta steineri]